MNRSDTKWSVVHHDCCCTQAVNKPLKFRVLCGAVHAQVPTQSWGFPDRTGTSTGATIAAYLAGKVDQDDAAIHLLFSANRWEKRCGMPPPPHACSAVRSCVRADEQSSWRLGVFVCFAV